MKLSTGTTPKGSQQSQQVPGKTPTALQSLIPAGNTGLVSAEKEQYDDIKLEDHEREEALRLARREKYFALKRQAYQEELRRQDVMPVFTADMVFDIIQNGQTYKGHKFVFPNEAYTETVRNLCKYFTQDARFEGDLKKGLALFGGVGTGKTALMKFFTQNPYYSYRVKSILEITMDYKQHGEEGVIHYNTNLQGIRNVFGMSVFGLCIDEVGIEQIPAIHYKEEKNVFSEILQMRNMNVPLHTTHITSNVPLEDFLELYGTRVYDRMREMFNVITFNKIESFRK